MAVMRRQGSLAVVSLTACVIGVAGHGSLNTPPARNSIDRFLPEFINGKAPTGSCSCNCGSDEKGCDAGIRQSGGGQSCLWFSQGCSIGCKTCTGIGSHSAVRLCNDSTLEPTLPHFAWTMNRWAVEGTSNDSYRYSPWRAPGTAPVMDACGQAGGTYPWHGGPGVAVFANTSFARFGDLGSHVLPPAPSGAIWKAGSSVEVTWGIRFNHGGGYSYRLCPSSEAPTEECFARLPLKFDRTKQALLFNNGTRYPIVGTFVSEGTHPKGSEWAMNPIPRIDYDDHSSGQPKGWHGCKLSPQGDPVGKGCRQFEPPCPWDNGWFPQPGGKAHNVDVEGACSGDWTGGVISDHVLLPKDLPPGDYVLGWRWDCEESTQVWSNCADVTVIA